VIVEEVCGKRARISQPMNGWVTMKNSSSKNQYLFKVNSQNKLSDTLKEDKVFKLSQKEFCEKNISAIETRMKAIQYSEEKDEMSVLDELRSFKTFFLELMCPEIEWKCNRCTFLNSPEIRECKVCSSERLKHLSAEMAVKLEGLLASKEPRVEEKKSSVLLSAETKSPRVDKLERQVKDLSKRYGMVAEQVYNLEEANWQLSSHLMDLETTLSTCVLDIANPKTWDVVTVSSWLARLGAEEYQTDFEEAMIDGNALLSCDSQRLDELDVRRKHRPMILKGIAELRAKWIETISEVCEPVEEAHESIEEKPAPGIFSLKPPKVPADDLQELYIVPMAKSKIEQLSDSDGEWEFVADV